MLEQNYLYKNGKTLKNKYGITDPQKLYARCAHDTARAAVNFRLEPPPRKFDAAYIKTIHWSLFYKTFEWAGQTRDTSFTFADGSTARMPAMRPKGYEVPFAVGSQIQKELKKLERNLTTKNNLRGLSRQQFAEEAAEVFMALNYAHPFRKGNGRVNRMFMEKLGEAAGHKIDFSFITQERMNLACIEAMQNGNSQPMKDLFEDITHPQKAQVLKEFIYQMRSSGLHEINNRLVIAAKEGVTYDGLYRGSSAEGFVLEVENAFVVGHKDDLLPEQIKNLHNGARICFEKTNVQNLREFLIPKETLAPLSSKELFDKLQDDPYIEKCQKQVEHLSKRVFGKRHVLRAQMEIINGDPSLGEQFVDQIAQNPKFICKLAGSKFCGIKSPSRRRAEENLPRLCEALKNYVTTIQQTKEEILEQHVKEQNRLGKSVEKPTKNLQTLFSLPAEQQREVLSYSPMLQQELHTYGRQIHNRLSSEERKAIQDQDITRLSCLLGTSESKAKNIAKVVDNIKEAQCQARALKISRSSSLAFTS
ncbi:BID domain-containing T4SS effector [Bartonella vinsonii]|uniref:protein adenylyltransferase n=1 Tax=Bartonella vinsonii subsp. berkhoffii str. Tweed TaxID=1094502 RepID=N6UWX1_BARVB|nr:BID domain-containing T4SS effector [Bartonella vinsonii]ENN94553.1 Bep protein [Bartonella vinsonii subsp. berkhoffii str. Tweed]